MIADLRPPGLYRGRFDIVDKGDHVRNPGVNRVGREFYPTDLESAAQDKVLRATQRKRHQFSLRFGFYNSGLGFETDISERSGDFADETGETARPVAAHLRFPAVTIVVTHPKISFAGRWFDQQHTIGPYASMTVR